jgi:uncharacterized membrane protein
MNEFIDNIRVNLESWGELTQVVLNAISLLFIILGVILSVVKSIKARRIMPGDHPLHTYFRKTFGGWLIVALEFQLAADIVGTIVSPTTAQLIELGAIALIRTFLNYFLNKELSEKKIVAVVEKKIINQNDHE